MGAAWILLSAFLASAPSVAQGVATVPVLRAPPSGDVVVPILLTSGDGITEMEFVLGYDPLVVTPSGAYTTGFTAGYVLTPTLLPPDRVRLTLDGSVLQGSGEVAWVTFHVLGAAGSTSWLSWRGCLLNGGLVPCVTQDGRIDVAAASVTVRVPDDARGGPGASAVVSISSTSFTNVEAMDLTLRFDPEVLHATSVTKTALTASLTLTSNLSQPGVARLSFFGTTPISGAGNLADITFQIVGGLSAETPLDLSKALFNEGSPSTVSDDGLFLVCLTSDGDGDLQSSCDGDCNDDAPLVFLGAAEICDGVDNDCNGWVDDVAAPTGRPTLSLARDPSNAVLSWTPVVGATAYDVNRGGIDLLRQTGGEFATATDNCLADDETTTSVSDDGTPPPTDGFWYLVRAVTCGGAGTYDDGSSSQFAPRDAGISTSPESCP